jgi:hypothetical protein
MQRLRILAGSALRHGCGALFCAIVRHRLMMTGATTVTAEFSG